MIAKQEQIGGLLLAKRFTHAPAALSMAPALRTLFKQEVNPFERGVSWHYTDQLADSIHESFKQSYDGHPGNVGKIAVLSVDARTLADHSRRADDRQAIALSHNGRVIVGFRETDINHRLFSQSETHLRHDIGIMLDDTPIDAAIGVFSGGAFTALGDELTRGEIQTVEDCQVNFVRAF